MLKQINRLLKAKIKQTKSLLPALGFVWQCSRNWTIARLILLTIQSALPLLSLYLTKLLVDILAASISQSSNATNWSQLLLILSLGAIVTFFTTTCNAVSNLVQTAQEQKVIDYMQDLLYGKSIEVDLEYYENHQYHNILQRAQQEAAYRPSQILNRLAQVYQNSITLVLMVALLLSLHWILGLVLLLAALPGVLVQLKYSGIMYQWQRQRTPRERQSRYLSWLLTGDLYAKEVRLFGLGSLFRQRFRAIRQELYQEKLALISRRSVAYLIAQALAGIMLLATYVFIVWQTVNQVLQLGDLVLYHQALQRGQNALKALMAGISGLYEDSLFLSNLYEFLSLKPKLLGSPQPCPCPRPIKQGIVFEGVSFKYPNTDRQALKNISLTLHPQETIALVGANGSGKTTLIKLLCRLYEPTSGSITWDGVELGQMDVAELRQQISVLFQDYAKYQFTAQDNIWFGNIQLPVQAEKIRAAATCSGADQAIARLPQGYDTVLGKLFEQGEELSIGQWQKVALARAFFREAQVIVLDEPSSALDPEAEAEMFEQFRQLLQDKSAIAISHRLSTVKMVDCIYVLEQGEIVESGTHEELISLGGTYARLFETQAQNYR